MKVHTIIYMLMCLILTLIVNACSQSGRVVLDDIELEWRKTPPTEEKGSKTMSRSFNITEFYNKNFVSLSSAVEAEVKHTPALLPYLRRLAEKADPTERAKWHSSKSPKAIQAAVDRMLTPASSAMEEEILRDDRAKWSKFGPQGGHESLADRTEAFREYFRYAQGDLDGLTYTMLDSSEFSKAFSETVKDLRFSHRLRPLTPEAVLERMKLEHKLSTNCGIVPGASFQRRSLGIVKDTALRLAKSGDWKQPYILGSRHSQGKDRFIFMSSMVANIEEGRYLYPLMDHVRKLQLDFFAPWEGNDAVQKVITKLSDENPDALWLSADYTGFDMHFTARHAQVIAELVKAAFQKEFAPEIDEIFNYMSNSSIIIMNPAGQLVQSNTDHSLLSGWGWTNTAETLLQYIISKVMKLKALGLGDDLVGCNSEFHEPKDLITYFCDKAKSAGLESNAEKQFCSHHKMHFLKRWYYKDFRNNQNLLGGVYPVTLATNSLVYPERFHDPRWWTKYHNTIRNLMICENCKDHPKFVQFAKFVASGDKYVSEFLSLTSSEKIRLFEDARSKPAFIPSYNQEKIHAGLESFITLSVWNS